jgi:predicted enzyme related to lactoylglutathione lyase
LLAALLLGGASHSFADGKVGKGNTMKNAKGAIVFFEIATTDLEKSKSFYQELFGWKFQDLGLPDARLIQAPNLEGLLEKVPGHAGGQSVVVYMQVDHIKESFARAIALGGKEIIAPKPAPGRGSIAVLRDLDGNRIGIFSSEPAP